MFLFDDYFFKKNAEVGDARTTSAFRFRYAHSPVTTKKCAAVASIPAPQQATVCVRTIYYQSLLFISAVRVQARTPVRGGGGANYFKLMPFSPETEFTPLILASRSEFSYDSQPLCKNPLFRTPFFESLCTDLGYTLSKSILL